MGSIPRSMYSLFELMTLEGWQQVGRPLVSQQPLMAIFFFSFIMIFTFGLLNMVVAVVVEKTLLQAKNMDQLDEHEQQLEVEKTLREMQDAFQGSDVNHDGMIDRDEFAEAMQETDFESPQGRLVVCLDRLGIPTHDALALFDILDSDASGELSMQEFIKGCARVRGASDPNWDQLHTHSLVLGLKKNFQEFRQEVKETLSRILSPEESINEVGDLGGSPQFGCAHMELRQLQSPCRGSGASKEDSTRMLQYSDMRLENLRRLDDEFVPKSDHQRVVQEQKILKERLDKVERQLLKCLEQR